MMRRAVPITAVLVLAFGLPANAGMVTPVMITDAASGFQPRGPTIRLTTVVRWQKSDDLKLTATGLANVTKWRRVLQPGAVRDRVFRQVGRFPYICTIHTSMKGASRLRIWMPDTVTGWDRLAPARIRCADRRPIPDPAQATRGYLEAVAQYDRGEGHVDARGRRPR